MCMSDCLQMGLQQAFVLLTGSVAALCALLLQELMQQMVKLPAGARAATKAGMRGDFDAAWLQYALEQEASPQGFADTIAKPETVAAVGGALQRLSKGSTKKKQPQSKL